MYEKVFINCVNSYKSGDKLTCVYVRNAVNEFSYSGADNTSDSKGDYQGKYATQSAKKVARIKFHISPLVSAVFI